MSDVYPSNRRDAIVQLASAVAVASLLSKARPAQASSDASPSADAAASRVADDVTLNALLQVELNAITAYIVGAEILSAAEDGGAPDAGGDPNVALAPVVIAVAVHFRAQHMMHRDALTALIQATDGLPIAASTFVPPTGFKPSVLNVIRLACNAERAAAVAYTDALKGLNAAQASKLAASIGGVETQHFVVLYALLQGLIAGNATTLTNATSVVPQAFVASVGAGTTGLEAISPFSFM
jgi:hypothetical protein